VTRLIAAALLVHPTRTIEVFPRDNEHCKRLKDPSSATLFHRIRRANELKLLFSRIVYPIPRGTAWVQSRTQGYLWTVGFVPRLQTYTGKEVPNPLFIEVTHGRSSISWVLQDVLALTKLNCNACIFADGEPVTLKFADRVGEILTAGPIGTDTPPLPFKFYI